MSRPLSELKGEMLAKAYARLLSIELRGTVHGTYTKGRRIEVNASGLPSHPKLQANYPQGWSMLARHTPAYCRNYVANRGCIGQWHLIL